MTVLMIAETDGMDIVDSLTVDGSYNPIGEDVYFDDFKLEAFR